MIIKKNFNILIYVIYKHVVCVVCTRPYQEVHLGVNLKHVLVDSINRLISVAFLVLKLKILLAVHNRRLL